MPLEHYILDGHNVVKAVGLMTWAKWMEENYLNLHVADETIGDIRVSTVFLGLDHNFGSGKPLLFETMVFGGLFNNRMNRYSTWEEAVKGHNKMVKRIKKEVEV